MVLKKEEIKTCQDSYRSYSQSFLGIEDKIQHLVKTVTTVSWAVQASEPSWACELMVMPLAAVGVRA